MSDTPRTDKECGEVTSTESGCSFDGVNANFARILERESAALRAVVARDRQYHMDAINRLASTLAFHGTSFEVVQAAIDSLTRMAGELTILHAEVEALRWQPIETAPKDGRTILLGRFNELGKWRTMRGKWCSKGVIKSEWENVDCDEGWYETSVENEDIPNCWFTAPSHWMPLPKPPAIDAAMGDKNADE